MSESPKRLFFVISGEHDTLPSAELRAILSSEKIPFSTVHSTSKLLVIDAPSVALNAISERSLMAESCGTVILETSTRESLIQELVGSSLPECKVEGKSFVVRSLRVPGSDKRLRREKLERDIGAVLLSAAGNTKVSLKNPDKTFLAILSPGRITFGVIHTRRRKGEIHARRPRKRPFFHPSTMQPKLARCMVNLARARPGGLLLDPFCGAGGHLIEGALIGCRILGLDISDRMIRGTKKNLKGFGLQADGLVKADARYLPFSHVDSIVTDMPYGRASSTAGLDREYLVNAFLKNASRTLNPGEHACVATFSPLDINRSESCGFLLEESYQVYVHRSVTRHISVLRREA